jgi:hypothetical protein
MTNPQENNALNLDALKQQLEALCTEHHLVKFAPEEMIELIQDGEEVAWLMEQLLGTGELPYRAELQQNLTNIKTVLHPEAIEIEAEPVEVEELKPTELIIDGFSTGMEPVAPMGFTPEMLENLDEYDLPPELKVPGVSMDQMKEMLASPQGSFMMDFMTFCTEQGIDVTNLMKTGKGSSTAIEEYRAQWMETPREAFDGKTPREYMEENPDLKLNAKVSTYRREAPKVGRNEPCLCGSGKKYKKCCGLGL